MGKTNAPRQAYFVGGGLASLAGAVYLIQDAGFAGKDIHIIESLSIIGGSNDGSGERSQGFVCRGGRMLNEETYENFWDLTSRIPSLEVPNISLKDEILAFDHANPTHAKARLIDKESNILDAHSMGFTMDDRMSLLKLFFTDENELDHVTIRDWFTEEFFKSNFWLMWQTTFAWQEWSSLFEFKRYMHRMILEFSRIDTLEGVTRTPYNQYESLILPLQKYLLEKEVNFMTSSTVSDLDFASGPETTVNGIQIQLANGTSSVIALRPEDLCFFTNGCITDNSSLGDYRTPAKYVPNNPPSFQLWKKISLKRDGLGNPEPFFQKPDETKWQSFTATFRGHAMLKLIENFSGNKPGSGALMTFIDSPWRMSIVVAAQPHFKAQGNDLSILWGYGLYPDAIGHFVKKSMIDCTGEEILDELIGHLHFQTHTQSIKDSVVNVIPAMLPYIDALFQPRAKADRPPVIPRHSSNFAMISQFVEIPDDMVFTEEYSVRAARTAVYGLLSLSKEVSPVTRYDKKVDVLAKAVHTAYR